MGVEIALAIGFSGIAATAAGAAINGAAAFGVSYIASRLSGKNSKGSGAARGSNTTASVAADAPRVAMIGEAAVAGSLVYYHTEGASNNTQCRIYSLVDHECSALVRVIVNGKSATVGADGVVPGYNGKLRIRWYSGAPGQTADPDVIAASEGRWTVNHKGTGVCYAIVWADYDEKLFPNDFPTVVFVVRGAKLYDPRTGVTAYSDNWGVATYNVLRGIFQAPGAPLAGLNAPAGSIRSADAVAACNLSDELVPRLTGGPEKRYRVGAVLYSTQTAREQLETVLAAGGDVIECGGLLKIVADAEQAPVAALTDADIIAATPLTWSARAPLSRLVNTIEATWLAPSSNYASTPLPPRSSAIDRAADGGIRLAKSLNLEACPSATQAQRIMEFARRQARRQGVATLSVGARWCLLEPGDWITVSSARQGWVDRPFMVAGAPQTEGMIAALTLVEVDDALGDWSAADEITAGETGELGSAAPPAAAVSGLALISYTQEAPSGAQRPGLRLTWAPPSDRTIVSLRVRYRKAGSADEPLEVHVLDPETGSYSWVTGVQGGVTYEASVRAETLPVRTADWSGWVAATSSAPAYIVPVAAEALYIDPSNIPPAELSAQEGFELRMTYEMDAVQGSIAARLAEIERQLIQTNEALGESLRFGVDNDAFIRREEVTRVTATEALAQDITTLGARLDDPETGLEATALAASVLEARVAATEDGLVSSASAITTLQTATDDNTSSITQILSDENGHKRFSIVMDTNGKTDAFVSLDGSQTLSSLVLGVGQLLVADPTVDGGAPLPLLKLANVGGQAKLILNGTLVAKLIESEEINALSGKIGRLTAGELAGAKMYQNLTTGEWWIDA